MRRILMGGLRSGVLTPPNIDPGEEPKTDVMEYKLTVKYYGSEFKEKTITIKKGESIFDTDVINLTSETNISVNPLFGQYIDGEVVGHNRSDFSCYAKYEVNVDGGDGYDYGYLEYIEHDGYETPSGYQTNTKYKTFMHNISNESFKVAGYFDGYFRIFPLSTSFRVVVSVKLYVDDEWYGDVFFTINWQYPPTVQPPTPDVKEGGLSITLNKGLFNVGNSGYVKITDELFTRLMCNNFGEADVDKFMIGVCPHGEKNYNTNSLWNLWFVAAEIFHDYNIDGKFTQMFALANKSGGTHIGSFDKIGVSLTEGSFKFANGHDGDLAYITGFSDTLRFTFSKSEIERITNGLSDDTLLDIGIYTHMSSYFLSRYVTSASNENLPVVYDIPVTESYEPHWASIWGGTYDSLNTTSNPCTWYTVSVGQLKEGVGMGANLSFSIG